jgi:hypothetical protein
MILNVYSEILHQLTLALSQASNTLSTLHLRHLSPFFAHSAQETVYSAAHQQGKSLMRALL